jgi:uncharacterized membrane protein
MVEVFAFWLVLYGGTFPLMLFDLSFSGSFPAQLGFYFLRYISDVALLSCVSLGTTGHLCT